MKHDPHGMIRERREAVTARVAELDAEREALRLEAQELEIAARVVARFGFSDEVKAEDGDKSAPLIASEAIVEANMPEMIISALSSAGHSGMTPQEVLDYIRGNLRPEADPNHVRPALWRLWKRDRAAKRGERYYHERFAPVGADENGALNGHAASTPETGEVAASPLDSREINDLLG